MPAYWADYHICPSCKINSQARTPVSAEQFEQLFGSSLEAFLSSNWCSGLSIKQTNMGQLISTWGSLPHECSDIWRQQASVPFFRQIEKGRLGFQWSDWKAESAPGRLTYFLTLDIHPSQANPRLMAGPGGARVGCYSHPNYSHTQEVTQFKWTPSLSIWFNCYKIKNKFPKNDQNDVRILQISCAL